MKATEIELNNDSRISLDKMREIWNDAEHVYTDEQLGKMRDFAYLLTKVIYAGLQEGKRSNIIVLTPNSNETEESNIVHPGKYRRAG